MKYSKENGQHVNADLEKLWLSFHAGNTTSPEELYLQVKEFVYRIAYQISPLFAYDLMNETFAFFLEKRGEKSMLAYKSNFKGWLYRVVRNHCLRQFKKLYANKVAEKPSAYPQTHANPGIESMFECSYLYKVIDDSFHTNEVQKAIVLQSIEGFSNPEIATNLGIPVDSVRKRKHRALAKLRANISPSRL